MTSLSRSLTVLAVLTLVPAVLQAQAPLGTWHGDNPGDFFGWANSGVGDMNHDGYDDIALGAPLGDPGGNASGYARVYSGKDGTVIWAWNGLHPNDKFGQFVSDTGDVNADGWVDVAVAVPNWDGNAGTDTGAVDVYSGKTGTLLYRWEGDFAGDIFGDQIADAGDMNLDGYADVASSTRLSDVAGTESGMIRVFSGKDGAILHTWYGAHPGDLLGGGLDGAGDVNNDGVPDIIGGSRWADPNGTTSGSATVFSGADFSVLYEFEGQNAGDGMGNTVGGAGDLNHDGYDDLLVGVWHEDGNGTDCGGMYVFSGIDGSEMFHLLGDSAGDVAGVFVSRTGDINRDGTEDFMTGMYLNDDGATDAGTVRVYSGVDGSILFDVHGWGVGDQLGVVLAEANDFNADGWPDIVSGGYWNDDNGTNSGMARVFSGMINVLPTVGTGLAGTGGVPKIIGGSTLLPSAPFTLKVNDALGSSTGHLIAGFSAINHTFKGGIMIPSPDLLIAGLPLNVYGQLLVATNFPPGIPSGFQLWFQFWIGDPQGPQGFSATPAVHVTAP